MKNINTCDLLDYYYLVLQGVQRYCYRYLLEVNPDPAPRLHCCFLTAASLFLHPLPFLVNNCLNLTFGTQGSS